MTASTTSAETAARIESLVEAWRTRLLDVDKDAVHVKPTSDRWSLSEVVGHLVDSACNNHQRFVRAQYTTDLEFPAYQQNEWVAAGHYQQSDWESLVQLWSLYNRQIAVVIRNIPDSKLTTPCTIAPSDSCTLQFLVTDYLDHLQHHLSIVASRLEQTKTEAGATGDPG